MTKQEHDNAIKKLDAETWTAFSSEHINEIAEKKDEINSQYIASLESQNAQLTAELTRIKSLTPEQFEAEFKGESK